jgi:hypothetical protein
MPSRPKTLLSMIAVPALRGSAAPQGWLSGLAASPLPLMVFDDDLPRIGSPTNCTLRFAPVRAPFANARAFTIAGVTRDSSGAALAGVTVKLFSATDDVARYSTVSDANGNYSFSVPSNGWTWYAIAYKAGAPDVAGTTANTLVAQ